MRVETPDEMLTARIHREARSAGVNLDTYDPDFIIGVTMAFLAEHQAVLTPRGVVKEAAYSGRSAE